ncbi:MAG: hypothetical protein HQL71_09975 [Magnetococcales bacterium]|nr:hypothetical protein [Magnetococcales bacterium]
MRQYNREVREYEREEARKRAQRRAEKQAEERATWNRINEKIEHMKQENQDKIQREQRRELDKIFSQSGGSRSSKSNKHSSGNSSTYKKACYPPLGKVGTSCMGLLNAGDRAGYQECISDIKKANMQEHARYCQANPGCCKKSSGKKYKGISR